MKGLVAQQDQKVNHPLIFLPRIDNRYSKFEKLPAPEPQSTPQFIPVPYPVPTQGNQGNNQGGFNFGRALGAMAGYLGMGFVDPAFSLGPILAGRYSDLMKETNERINSGRTPGIISEMPRRIQGNYRPRS